MVLMGTLFQPIEVTLFCTRNESNKVRILYKRIIFCTLFCDDLPCGKKGEKDTDVTYLRFKYTIMVCMFNEMTSLMTRRAGQGMNIGLVNGSNVTFLV